MFDIKKLLFFMTSVVLFQGPPLYEGPPLYGKVPTFIYDKAV